jgi:hypothetical protein
MPFETGTMGDGTMGDAAVETGFEYRLGWAVLGVFHINIGAFTK